MFLVISDFIFDFMISNLKSGHNNTTDVTIHCRDGALPGHKLVLASISPMFRAVFTEDTWDETITVLMPEFSTSVVTDYFEKIFRFREIDQYHELNNCIGCNNFKNSSKVEAEVKVKEEVPLLEPEEFVEFGNVFEQREDNGWMEGGGQKHSYSRDIDGVNYDDEYEDNDDGNHDDDQKEKSKTKSGKRRYGYSKSKKDFVWDHFVKTSDELRTCKHCGTVVKVLQKRIGKMRDHILEKHRELISHDHRNHLLKFNNIDIDNYDLEEVRKLERKKRADRRKELLPDEPVIDPETGNMLSKDALMKDIKIRETKNGNPRKPSKHSPVWEYFGPDPNNPAKRVCRLCQASLVYVFKNVLSTSMLKYHLQAHHNLLKEDMKIHICSHCGKSFKKNSLRLLCEDKHNNIFKHICSLCGKGFVHKQQLNKHMRVHTGETPHQCTECGKRFKEKTQLNTHMRVHTGETPYECSKCFQKFKFVATRNNHSCI